jgi:hypothetical protein
MSDGDGGGFLLSMMILNFSTIQRPEQKQAKVWWNPYVKPQAQAQSHGL